MQVLLILTFAPIPTPTEIPCALFDLKDGKVQLVLKLMTDL